MAEEQFLGFDASRRVDVHFLAARCPQFQGVYHVVVHAAIGNTQTTNSMKKMLNTLEETVDSFCSLVNNLMES